MKKIYAMVADQSPTLEQSNVRINFLIEILVYTGVEKISKKYNMPVFYLNIKLIEKDIMNLRLKKLVEKIKMEKFRNN